MTEDKGAAPAPSTELLDQPRPGGPVEYPAPGINTEVGPPRIVIPYVQNKLRDETRTVGEQMGATFVDVTGEVTAYFTVVTRQWESGYGFLLMEEDVVPSIELLTEMWECEAEWCSAFFWSWHGAIRDGEPRPQRPGRHRISNTMALNKFGSGLLRRVPRAMQDAINRTNRVRHFNQLDLALVHEGGVLQGHPYYAVPHTHGPVDHRTPPDWVSQIGDGEWVDG